MSIIGLRRLVGVAPRRRWEYPVDRISPGSTITARLLGIFRPGVRSCHLLNTMINSANLEAWPTEHDHFANGAVFAFGVDLILRRIDKLHQASM